MTKVVGVRFKDTGKTYYFDPKGLEIKKGDLVVVETNLPEASIQWLCSHCTAPVLADPVSTIKAPKLLPVLDSLDRALEVADKDNDAMAAMVEGIELTRKSMLDVVAKFGVQVVADIDVPMDPNVHQAIAMVESDDVAAGNVLMVMQKGYTLNGRTIRAAMVSVAKAKG